TPSDGQLDANLNADGSAARSFSYDNSAPTSRVTLPAPSLSAPPTSLGGTSDDAFPLLQPSGVNNVRIKLRRSNGDYWNFVGSSWGGDPGWSSQDSTVNPWSKGVPAGAFNDGYLYSVNSWARDAATNDEQAYSTYTFVVDRSTPVAQVSNPAHLSFLGTVTQISGTAEDRYCALNAPFTCPGAAGLDYESGVAPSSVVVSLRRFSDEQYWNGNSAFDAASPIWSTATFVGYSSGVWTYAMPGGALVDSSSYTVSARVARDRGGNVQTVVTTHTFTVDAQDPAAVSTGPTGVLNTMVPISGTARDPAAGELDVVLLRIRQSGGPGSPAVWMGPPTNNWVADGEVWTGTGTIGALITGTTYAWAFDSAAVAWRSNASYQIFTRARDKGSRHTVIPGAPDITFTISGPQSGIATPGTGEPHFQSANLGTILGTAVNSSTVALRLIQAGPDNTLGEGNDDLVWTGGAWVSTSPWPGSCAAAECFIGVTSSNPATTPMTWSHAFSVGNWVPGRRYKAESKGFNGGDPEVDFTGGETRNFVIDNAAPAVAVGVPDLSWHRAGQLGTLTGTATDATPGQVSNPTVKFRIVRLTSPACPREAGTSPSATAN
ncbi:MAG: hypothetical protein FD126_2899, partial [Elusimicrobia bacterium]